MNRWDLFAESTQRSAQAYFRHMIFILIVGLILLGMALVPFMRGEGFGTVMLTIASLAMFGFAVRSYVDYRQAQQSHKGIMKEEARERLAAAAEKNKQ